MGFDVRLYSGFRKLENSTLRPSTTGGDLFQGSLKEDCSILSPTISFRFAQNFAPALYNYAYIKDFGRFYYIEEWTNRLGIWTATMRRDPLATFRTQIGSSTQYILRCSYESDGNIIDNEYPTTANITQSSSDAGNPWSTTLGSGRYVVGIINSDVSGVGAVSYYVFTQTQLNTLNNYLLTNSGDWVDSSEIEITEQLTKVLFNPYEYISSVKWVPFEPPQSGVVTNLRFGWWNIPISCSRLSNTPLYSFTLPIPVINHPQSSSRGNFLNLNPYTRASLIFRPFGVIPLDMTYFAKSSVISLFVNVDCISGAGTVRISSATASSTYVEVSAKVAVDIQLAQIGIDYLSTATAVANVGESIARTATSFGFGGGSIASSIESAVRSALPQLQTSGGNGSVTDFYNTPRVLFQFSNIVDENNTNKGRPLCKNRVISNIPGFIVVNSPQLDLPATLSECLSCKEYMQSGFYYE